MSSTRRCARTSWAVIVVAGVLLPALALAAVPGVPQKEGPMGPSAVEVVSLDLLRPSDTAPVCARPGTKPRIAPVGSQAYGRSYDEWSQAWWQWALSMPPGINPILDGTGESCAYGQHGPVWFLAGNFGGTTVRSCSVGCNKSLFFPLINCEWENAWVGQPVLSIDDLRALCAGSGTPTTATVEVDGQPLSISLTKQRVVTSLFDYGFGPDNLGGQPPGTYFPTISDGVWVMLDPLPPGLHTVRITSTTPSFALDVTYHLDVIALELPCSSPPCP